MKLRTLCRLLAAAGVTAIGIAAPALVADELSKPIAVSRDGRFLTSPDGAPFFWLGDTAWDLFRALTLEEARVYLDDRAKRGFNVIQAPAVFGGYGTPDALEGRNRYGDCPFIGGRIERPNPTYFAHVDQVIDEAHARGLRVAMHPIWGALNASRTGFLTPETGRAYGNWLGARYRGKHLIWVLGGDVAPVAPRDLMQTQDIQELVDYRPLWDAMAEGIADGEGGDPFMTYHPSVDVVDGAPEPRTSLFFSQRAWLDMNAIESGHEAESDESYVDGRQTGVFLSSHNYEIITKEYWSSPVRPVIDFEVRYEHPSSCVEQLPRAPCWHDHDVRGVAYQAVFAGAAGHSYGNYSLWDFFDPSKPRTLLEHEKGRGRSVYWRTALEAPGGDDMRHLKALMLSRPYFDRIPDQSVIVTATGAGDQHIAATRSRGGSYLMAFLPEGQRVVVDLTKIAGEVATGWWFDPRTGKASRIEGDLPTNDRRTFAPPTSGEDQDWVLVLDDKNRDFGAPGAARSSRPRSRALAP